MLKFRFRKKEMRRRSNSCPNLDSGTTSFGFGSDEQEKRNKKEAQLKHTSCYLEGKSGSDSGTDDEPTSPSRKEQLHAQKSIRRVKKKEKEQQENVEKNLLSSDDFWRKLDSLKDWLQEQQGKKEVENMQSPKLRSHFKKFIKLWNKRKLPLKYYRNCCIDAEEGSSGADNPSHQGSTSSHGTLELTPHTTLRNLPSYHRFPFIDESVDELDSVFSTPVSLNTESVLKDSNSPFSTFGKSPCDPLTSTSLLAKQVEVHSAQNSGVRSKLKSDQIVPPTSPSKFATISRSTLVSSSIFKSYESSSPQLHPVVSPACPSPSHFVFPRNGKETPGSEMSPYDDSSVKKQSPAYMSVQDAIPFACNSPKYWQVEFDPVFEHEPDYCSLSPFSSKKKPVNICRKGSNLSRRRSKSMEDIYAVPSRLMNVGVDNMRSPCQDEIRLKTPPVPVKRFTPTPSMVNLGIGRKSLSFKVESENIVGSEIVNSSEIHMASSSDISSVNSLSTDLGYQSYKHDELSKSRLTSSSFQPASSFQSHTHKEKAGVKRRSGEDSICVDAFESFKKSKSNCANETEMDDTMSMKNEVMVKEETTMGIADFLKDSPVKTTMESNDTQTKKQIPKLSILTGSLNPTVRSPKTFDNISDDKRSDKNDTKEKDDSRQSILEIKVLDSSPTFPRRRLKRRSSSLSVTPGKALTFGKNSRFAMSSPRRVSFAKNVKNGDDKNTTPWRQRSSSSKASSKSTLIKQDISQQSQHRTMFESFWANHQPATKSNSPTKEIKSWSPMKWLSPTKNNSSCDTNNVSLESLSRKNNSLIDHSPSKGSDSTNYHQHEKKESFIKSLSPKKLLSSLQNNSSASLVSPPESNTTSLDNGRNLFKEGVKSKDIMTEPKSILKSNGSVQTSITSGCYENQQSWSITKDQDFQTSQKHALSDDFGTPVEQEDVSTNTFNRLNICKDLFTNVPNNSSLRVDHIQRHNESNLNFCRSPPRLGVASFRAKNNLANTAPSILFNCKPVSSSNSFSQTDARSTYDHKEIGMRVNNESRTNHQTDAAHCVAYADNEHKSFARETCFNSPPTHKIDPCSISNTLEDEEDKHPDQSSSKDCSLILTNGTSVKIFTDLNKTVEKEDEIEFGPLKPSGIARNAGPFSFNEKLNLETIDNNKCNFNDRDQISYDGNMIQDSISSHSDIQYVSECEESNDLFTTEASLNAGTIYDVPKGNLHHDSLSKNEDHAQEIENEETDLKSSVTEMSDLERPFQESHRSRPESSPSQDITVDDEDDKEISNNVLERIKSFRASPKVEENDGWITERRRSKGGKTKSFRSAHNRYLLRSASQEDSENESAVGKAKLENDENNEVSRTVPDVQEKLSNTITDAHIKDNITEGGDVDKGYETESKSKEEKPNEEAESMSSVASSDSGTGKFETEFPIYDVPRNGINMLSSVIKFAGKKSPESSTCQYGVDSTAENQQVKEVTVPMNSSIDLQNLPENQDDEALNKENIQVPKTGPKPLKPKPPLVKPKPTKGTVSSSSVYTKTIKAASASPQSTPRRQSSIYKRNPPPKLGQQMTSSPYKSKSSHNGTIDTRPVTRKRSSVTSKDSFQRKSFKDSPSATVAHKSADGKKESLTPRKKRTSLEKGRRTSGVAGPEQTSFAQRRKFFQQLQASGHSSSPSSSPSQPKTNVTHPLKIADSFCGKSKPQPWPKPVVQPKPKDKYTTII